MEALVLLLAEFLLGPLLAALGGLVTAAAAVLGALLELLFGLRARWRRAAAEPAAAEPATREPAAASPRWRRRVRWAVGGVLALALLSALAVELVLFEPAVRWLAARVAASTGIAVAFARAEGSLLRGRVVLHETSLRRASSPTSTFDLVAARLEVDVAVLGVLGSPSAIDAVRVDGLRGAFARVAAPTPLQPRRPFAIGELELRDARVAVTDHTRETPLEFTLAIDEARTAPCRSQWLAFDVLFRTNARGALDGAPFTIATRSTSDGRETRWQAPSLPLELAAAYIGGPLAWIDRGRVSVDVTDRWQMGERAEVELDWQLVLEDVHASVPATASPLVRRVAEPIVAWLNERGERLPLAFRFKMDPQTFAGATSIQATELLELAQESLTAALAERAGVPLDATRELWREGRVRFEAFLERRRRGK